MQKNNSTKKNILEGWQYKEIHELLDYEQPQRYIVSSTDYKRHGTPVLTAGKSFILGYTNEKDGIYSENLPVIIFDDFTTAHKYVDFPFKVKSSAVKILKAKEDVNLKFAYGWMNIHPYSVGEHKRNYLSEYQYLDVLVPSSQEQNRIVTVLEMWDKAVEKLKKKIELKKQIKKGLMQELLTGKKRLPGFTKEWKLKKLGDICRIRKGQTLVSKNLKKGNYPVIAGGKSSPYSHAEFCAENAITVSASGAYAGYVAFHTYKFWGSDCSIISEVENISDIYFLNQLLQLKQRKIYTYQTGGAQPHVYPKDLQSLKFLWPKLEEQKEIAALLTSADKEIQILEQKLRTYQEQKRFLLNNLITGAIRTPENMKILK